MNTESVVNSILLVEDNTYDYKAFSLAMANYPVNIVWCKTAEEAWPILENDPSEFDIVVTDYSLPNLSGLEFSHNIINNNIDIPIVLMTGEGSEYVAVEAMKLGVIDYIVKDINNEYLNRLPLVLSQAIAHFKAGKH